MTQVLECVDSDSLAKCRTIQTHATSQTACCCLKLTQGPTLLSSHYNDFYIQNTYQVFSEDHLTSCASCWHWTQLLHDGRLSRRFHTRQFPAKSKNIQNQSTTTTKSVLSAKCWCIPFTILHVVDYPMHSGSIALLGRFRTKDRTAEQLTGKGYSWC